MTIKNIVIIFLLCLISILLIPSCNDNTSSTNDNTLPKITAKIIGDVQLDYRAPGPMPYYTLSGDYKQLILTSGAKFQGQYYAIGVYIFFADKQEKTGTFIFRNKEEGEKGDFAVGVLQVGDNQKRLFFSDSGKVILNKVDGVKISGIFNFYATEQNGTAKVQVISGTLDFGFDLLY